MNHTDIIIIVVTLTITSTLGTYVAIKLVNQYMRPITNTLHRRNDIELVNYIDPTHPDQIYNHPELLPQPYHIWIERISNVPSYSTGNYGRPPTYLSGNSTLPSYQPIDRLNINSCLENAINLDYILWIILFFMFFFIVRYLTFRFLTKDNISTKQNIKNNLTDNISTKQITYFTDYSNILHDKQEVGMSQHFLCFGKSYHYILPGDWTIFDIKSWMNTFDNVDYIVIIEITGIDVPNFDENNPRIILSWNFVVNKNSYPVTISTHISQSIDKFNENFDPNFRESPSILISFTELKSQFPSN